VPSLEKNRELWADETTWRAGGDDWSQSWGGAAAQWHGSVLPRIRRYLPASTVVEIAPGYGRWTDYLLPFCDTLVGVDLSEVCVHACRTRFAGVPHASFFVNDGRSLDMVANGSADFIFSFDSLVHVEADVLSDYLVEIAAKLSPDGVAFIHHSNLGEHARHFARLDLLPDPLRTRLVARGVVDHAHLRAPSVTAEWLATTCAQLGLCCIGQELVNWGTRRVLLDCFSTIVRAGSPRARARRVVRNPHFMSEAESIRLASRLLAP
jgi:SAM-dependent methyltransferase